MLLGKMISSKLESVYLEILSQWLLLYLKVRNCGLKLTS